MIRLIVTTGTTIGRRAQISERWMIRRVVGRAEERRCGARIRHGTIRFGIHDGHEGWWMVDDTVHTHSPQLL